MSNLSSPDRVQEPSPASPPVTPADESEKQQQPFTETQGQLEQITAAIETTEKEEGAQREHIDGTSVSDFFQTQIEHLVELETVERSAVHTDEIHAFAELLGEASVGRETAARVADLAAELAALQQDNRELIILNESSTTLLEYLEITTVSLTDVTAQLSTRTHHLAVTSRRLDDARRRLSAMPESDHDTIEAEVDRLEKIASCGSGSADTTNSTIVQLWQNTPIPTRSTEPASASSDVLQVGELDNSFDVGVSYEHALSRCNRSHDRHHQICVIIETLLQNHEAKLAETQENKQALLKELAALCDKEISSLDQPRRQMKQVEEEQLYHIRRGTFIKERQSKVTHDQLLAEAVKGKHNHLCESLLRVQRDIDVVSNEVRDLRRSLDDMKRCAEHEALRVESRRAELQKDADEVARSRSALEAEAEDLKSLKQDVTRVLQFVRLKHKSY